MQRKYCIILSALFFLVLLSCAAPLKTDTISFRAPSSHPNYQTIDGLEIAVHPIDREAECREAFGTDLKVAGILPVQIIVRNEGSHEYEINHLQIFGVESSGTFTAAYSLGKSAEKVRASSIGTTAVTGAVAGALVGAAAGAAVGAGIGHAAGDAGTGAESGAIIGGTTGAVAGTGAGLSDSFTAKFKQELANLAFEDKVIYPGDMQQGFIYLKWKPYSKIRMKIFDITNNVTHELEFIVAILR